MNNIFYIRLMCRFCSSVNFQIFIQTRVIFYYVCSLRNVSKCWAVLWCYVRYCWVIPCREAMSSSFSIISRMLISSLSYSTFPSLSAIPANAPLFAVLFYLLISFWHSLNFSFIRCLILPSLFSWRSIQCIINSFSYSIFSPFPHVLTNAHLFVLILYIFSSLSDFLSNVHL